LDHLQSDLRPLKGRLDRPGDLHQEWKGPPPGTVSNGSTMEQQILRFDERRVLRISELVGELRGQLEPHFRDVWIQGEISNLRRPGSGHLYFTLKDDEAQISAVCFRLRSRYLKFEPEDGMDVVVRGSVTVYPARGQLQVMVEHMEPLGRGALQVAFEQLKARLDAEGLFDPAHKKKLPLLPVRIGVVTSPTGAAIQDILRVLKRRNDRVGVLLYPARVQGREAAREIAAGIAHLDARSDVDAIIVGRGGGSLEDLWPFNEEVVARAIFKAAKPIISAVGHEIDFTIADFVADLRAPTPSAAAEIVCGRREELQSRVRQLTRRGVQAARFQAHRHRGRYERLVRSRGFIDAESRVRFLIQRLDEVRVRLHASLGPVRERLRERLRQASRDLERGATLLLDARRHGLSAASEKLKAYSPFRFCNGATPS
jgi:exodeoxyribonuclease VII large subunit